MATSATILHTNMNIGNEDQQKIPTFCRDFLLMILPAVVDIKSAVELLQQQYTHELMGEGHGREGDTSIAHGLDRLGYAVGGADDKLQV